MRFVKLNEVKRLTGKSRASIYRAIQDGNFPAQVKLSERSSAWLESEIMEWQAERVAQRNTKVGGL